MHHGDGVQEIFYDDPRVLTVSLHETPLALFPGTGFPDETGGPGAEGTAVNVACRRAPTTRAGCAPSTRWCRACCGRSGRRCCSPSAAPTPTASTRWPTCGSPSTGSAPRYLALRDLADELCDGRWVATGGGGYALVEACRGRGRTCWRRDRGAARPGHADAARLAGAGPQHASRAPTCRRRMTDGGDRGVRAVAAGRRAGPASTGRSSATRAAVYPLHGLDPDDPRD